jgi:hypothetical protein
MKTKLTVNLNRELVDEAKKYAKSHNISLSKLIENHLDSLSIEEEVKIKVSLLVENLKGIIPNDCD